MYPQSRAFSAPRFQKKSKHLPDFNTTDYNETRAKVQFTENVFYGRIIKKFVIEVFLKMTVAEWILLAVFIINYGLILFAYLKKIFVLQKTCVCLTLPIAGTFIILRLTKYLPDSFHIILVTAAAFAIVSISTVFLAFEKIRTLRILGRIASLGNIVCWILFYRSIFKIHSVPAWFTILAAGIYAAIIIVSCIFSGKQELKFYAAFAVSFLLVTYLHFCSLIFLCWERTGNSIMLFAGTSIYAFLLSFHFMNTTKLKIKHAGGLRYNLLVISQILIACSNILMVR